MIADRSGLAPFIDQAHVVGILLAQRLKQVSTLRGGFWQRPAHRKIHARICVGHPLRFAFRGVQEWGQLTSKVIGRHAKASRRFGKQEIYTNEYIADVLVIVQPR